MAAPFLFVGQTVKSLKSIINFFGFAQISSDSTDPTTTPFSANIGSLKLDTANGNTYQKKDNGSSTNWSIFIVGKSNNVNGGTPSTNFVYTQNISGGTP